MLDQAHSETTDSSSEEGAEEEEISSGGWKSLHTAMRKGRIMERAQRKQGVAISRSSRGVAAESGGPGNAGFLAILTKRERGRGEGIRAWERATAVPWLGLVVHGGPDLPLLVLELWQLHMAVPGRRRLSRCRPIKFQLGFLRDRKSVV